MQLCCWPRQGWSCVTCLHAWVPCCEHRTGLCRPLIPLKTLPLTTSICAQGFEEEAAAVMQRHFQGQLLAELAAGCQAALAEMAQAFPYQPSAPDAGLTRFTQVHASAGSTSRMGGSKSIAEGPVALLMAAPLALTVKAAPPQYLILDLAGFCLHGLMSRGPQALTVLASGQSPWLRSFIYALTCQRTCNLAASSASRQWRSSCRAPPGGWSGLHCGSMRYDAVDASMHACARRRSRS